MKNTKATLLLSGLIFTIGLTGCSLVKDFSDKKDLYVKYNNELSFDNDNAVDEMLVLDEEETDELKFKYLIEASEYTNATLAHVVDEKTISSEKGFLKKEVSPDTFNESIYQPITLPISFVLFNCDDIGDLVDAYGDCKIDLKKLYTIDGETLYYFDSTFTFNSFAEKYIGLDIKENDTMNSKIVYRLEDDGSLTILYKNQTGFKSDCDNVKEKNFNNNKDLVVPIEKTVFSDLVGEYDEEYLLEALDVYNGTDLYYNENNEGKDFSSFKK